MNNFPSYGVIIPARFKSSRLPGKPLVDLCGKPMIQHVWERCCEAVDKEKVYVATDDSAIAEVVKQFGAKVIITSESCFTGTDRIAEANKILDWDFVVNVQGDEPLINPEHIKAVIDQYLKSGGIVNAMCKINTEDEFKSLTIPKVVFNEDLKLLYMSRAGIPLSKSGDFSFGYKQVCIYAFSREHLAFFSIQNKKSRLEEVEDIEILRFLEAGYPVQMLEVDTGSIAVDVLEDVERVRRVMETLVVC